MRRRLPCALLAALLAFAPALRAATSDGVPANLPTPTESKAAVLRASAGKTGDGTGDRTSGGSRRNNAVPAAVIGAVALAAIAGLLLSERSGATSPSSTTTPSPDQLTNRLLTEGPQMAQAFNMSAFAVRGLVRGGWPVLVDFEQRSPGSAQLRISARDLPDVYTYDLSQVCPPPRRCVIPEGTRT